MIIKTAATGPTGAYEFSELPEGEYDLLFGIPQDNLKTVTTDGWHRHLNIYVGTAIENVNEGALAPALDEEENPPALAPTGTRNGIKWDTLVIRTRTGQAFQGTSGYSHTVRTTNNDRWISVYETDVPSLITSALSGYVASYNCHGYTFETTLILCSDKLYRNFSVIDPVSADLIFAVQNPSPVSVAPFTPLVTTLPTTASAETALANGKNVFCVLWKDGHAIHSMVITYINTLDNGQATNYNNLDKNNTIGYSKKGFYALSNGVSLQETFDLYNNNGGVDTLTLYTFS